VVNLYGVPAKLDQIRDICREHGALLIEDAAESLGATYQGQQTGTFGTYNVVSFNGNKIITGSCGGALVVDTPESMARVRKWSTQSRENAPWYQHEELGYNYRMSNVVAGVVRGQFPYLQDHIDRKKAIYMRYKEGFKDLPVTMNPYNEKDSEPNYWLSCLLLNEKAMCQQTQTECHISYISEPGKSCPTEILEILEKLNAEGRPIWKPMHLQPIFKGYPFVTVQEGEDVGSDIFRRGLCLPSDIKMTEQEQDIIIEAIKECFA
jgi:dTDP-4-amino-4,6-dideoxygalactose transaminase